MTKTQMTDEEALARFEAGIRPDIVLERADFAELEAAVQARRDVENRVLNAVRDLRAKGASWSSIGLSLGVSYQAAIQRYRDRI